MRLLPKSLSEKWFSSIGTKLATLITLLIALISIFMYLFFPVKLKQQAIKLIAAKAQSVAQMTAFSISSALFFEDIEAAEEALQGTRRNHDLVYVVVLNESGNVFVAFNRDKAEKANYLQTKNNHPVSQDGSLYQISTNILSNDRNIGRLYLGLSLKDLQAEVNRSRTAIALISAAIFVIGMLAAIAISSLITGPLSQIVRTVQHISKGDLSQRTAISSRDEVGHLAKAFDLMVDNLESIQREIENANQTLEGHAKELQREIDERRRVEEELRESEERFRTISTTAKDAIVMMDDQGNIIYWNPTAEETFGYSFKEITGKELHRLLAPQRYHEAYLKGLSKFRQSGQGEAVGKTLELEAVRKDGTEFPIEISLSAIQIKGRWQAVGIVRDITERKQVEIKLKQTLSELERSNSELQHFAYVASHDLQEPLRMVVSYVQLLQRRYHGKLDSDADEFIAYAVDGTIRMQGLINDLLTYSRVGTRGRAFEPTECQAVLDRALSNLQMAIQESGAKITADPLPTVTADGSQLGQLFQNLIGNAIKFHSDEPSRVHISVQDRSDEWLFSIRDNGIGIAADSSGRIFEVFKRLHTRKEYPGTGIGLAICRKIVKRHGGDIWVESEPGQGSTFYFTIPKKVKEEVKDHEYQSIGQTN
jgi:PAS domain S-box-containing protein